MPTDRRSPNRERRTSPKGAKAGAAKAEGEAKAKPRAKRKRRLGERRESPRLPIPVWVKNASATEFEEVEGDISVGGMHFTDVLPIQGKKIDLRFRLPGREDEVHVRGEVVEVSSRGSRYGAHVRFTEVDTETELAIARYIDERTTAT